MLITKPRLVSKGSQVQHRTLTQAIHKISVANLLYQLNAHLHHIGILQI
jgi:hypothetical protein